MTDDLPDFDRFGHDDAWRVGSALVAHARPGGLPIVITITLGEQRVFHAALPGASADNDGWAERKSRVVRRFDRPSLEIAEQHPGDAGARFFTDSGLSSVQYALAGGAVPIRVHGTQVGVLAISGLESAEDHELALRGLRGDL